MPSTIDIGIQLLDEMSANYRAELTRLREENTRLREAVTGLMEIAEACMPDSYFASDSRVSIARHALGMKLGEPS